MLEAVQSAACSKFSLKLKNGQNGRSVYISAVCNELLKIRLANLGVVGLQSTARLDLGLENKKLKNLQFFFTEKTFSRQIHRI